MINKKKIINPDAPVLIFVWQTTNNTVASLFIIIVLKSLGRWQLFCLSVSPMSVSISINCFPVTVYHSFLCLWTFSHSPSTSTWSLNHDLTKNQYFILLMGHILHRSSKTIPKDFSCYSDPENSTVWPVHKVIFLKFNKSQIDGGLMAGVGESNR